VTIIVSQIYFLSISTIQYVTIIPSIHWRSQKFWLDGPKIWRKIVTKFWWPFSVT